MQEEEQKTLHDYALKLISFRPRTHKEIKDKLMRFSKKRKFKLQSIEKVIKDLIDQNLINDLEFARWWIEQRNLFRPKGTRALKTELFQKGVDRKTIDEALLTISGKKELDLAKKAISRKNTFFKSLSKRAQKIKISRFLSSRGFSWEVIYKVIDETTKKS